MKALTLTLAGIALAFAATHVDAAKRFGGGSNAGKQRPAMQEAAKAPAGTPATPAAAPAKPAAAPAAAPPAKPSFMQRWGGLLMGLGIGALLASMFGASMGPVIGMLLAGLALAAVAFLVYRLIAGRKGPQEPVGRSPEFATAGASPGATGGNSPGFSGTTGNSPVFSGIGSALGGSAAAATMAEPSVAPATRTIDPAALPASEVDGFVRVAKTSFIRLQAANDAGDLDDIRDYTTPEMYAEIAMQVKERGGVTQRVEVVSVDARLMEAVVEGDYAIASVRFTGLTREDNANNPEPFDEIWNVRKSLKERNGAWLIAGIQQVE